MFTHVEIKDCKRGGRVKFAEGKNNKSQAKEYESNDDFSRNTAEQLKSEDCSTQRLISRGVVDLDLDSYEMMDEDDVNLISCEIGEEKKTDTNILCSSKEDSFKEFKEPERYFANEQVLGEIIEQELLHNIFDDAPGFHSVKKSPKSRKTKSDYPQIDVIINQNDSGICHENSTVIHKIESEKHCESNWVKFEENGMNDNDLESSYSSMREWSDNECSDMNEKFLQTLSEPDKNASLTCTPIKQKSWVSFANETDFNQSTVGNEKQGFSESGSNDCIEALNYPSPISLSKHSNTSPAMLSGVFISDVYDIPDDICDSKKQATLVDLDGCSPDRNENISNECSISNIVPDKVKELIEDFETDSNFSGEIFDLNNIENDSLLRDTRKPFPKEGIFQASSTKIEEKQESEKKEFSKAPDSAKKGVIRDLCLEENNCTPLDDYPSLSTRTEWIFMYRYPDKKRKFGSRQWLPVKVEVKDDAINITGRFESIEIHKEIPLHPFFVFTMPVLHRGDGNEKVHSVKLQYVKYKETRKIASKFHIEHIPSYTPVLKIASKDHRSMKEFIDAVENVVRKIETHRDKGITHRHEEIFIDCDDICQYELDGDGRVKRYNITCEIRLRAFITGIPNLYLFLNDIMAYNKQKARRNDGKQPKSSRWIKLENIEYHPSVQVAASKAEGGVVFKPPDSCSFELMRFRVRNTRELPMLFKASIDFTTSKSFHIKSECKIGGDGRMMKHRRNNIVVRFPIPTTWTSVFVKSRSFGGQKKYVQARADQKTFASGIGRTSRCYIEVSTGTAKYEPEYGSVVWRVGDLPILATGVPADAVQTFDLQVNLPFEIDLPRQHELFAEIEYEIPHAVGSEIQIQEVLLSDGRTPDKWVCYRALYSYKVLMNVTNRQRLGDMS